MKPDEAKDIQDDLTVDVPPPLDHWQGEARIDDHNAQLERHRNARKARQLDTKRRGILRREPSELERYQAALDKLNEALDSAGIDHLLDEYAQLQAEKENYKIDLYNLERAYNRTALEDEETRAQIQADAEAIKADIKTLAADFRTLKKRIAPYKPTIAKRDRLERRLQEHYIAVRDSAQEKRDLDNMDKEARMVAEALIVRFNQLGYFHKQTSRDIFGQLQEKKKSVRFERIIATPDRIFLKLDVTRLGLLGDHKNNMPQGVYGQELCTPKVLAELSLGLERPVSSANNEGTIGWHKGVWYAVDRLGLTDGLPQRVMWSQVMKRYPEDKRHLMPVPMGIRAGKRINWINLTEEPHLMVNGVTGYGKSNCMQMFLATLIMKHSPDDIRFIICDMKNNGDFRWFEDLPHTLDTATEVEQAAALIERTYKEMKRRAGVIRRITNDISTYNKYVADEDKLPHIFFIFDEYPAVNIKKQIAKKVHEYAAHIAMQGRAMGVHMFISGQQSYTSDIPRQLLSNITAQFTARQQTASGAMATTGSMETLKMANVKGRFLYASRADREQVQMPFIDIAGGDIDRALREARKWQEPRPFALPTVDEKTENLSLTDEEIVLKTAFEEFEGQLKQVDIWQRNKGNLSRPRTKKAIERIIEQEYIEYEGAFYSAEITTGGSYQLLEIEPEELPISA